MGPRVRRSLQEIEAEYENRTDRVTLQKLIRAWRGVQDLPPSDTNSFYSLGGWHGEPFRGPGKDPGANGLWWGGYCNHGNVLFPTWHRAYLVRLEQALQSISLCEDVMLPFWDECFGMNEPDGTVPVVIPKILTSPKFTFDDEKYAFDGKLEIDNPLYSYKLAKDTSFYVPTPWDPAAEKKNTRYSKPKGYETCRFPMSGLVSTEDARKATAEWNAQFVDVNKRNSILNANVANWLEGKVRPSPNPENLKLPIPPPKKGEDPPEQLPRIPDTFSVYARFRLCLDAPNYTVFSNNVSAAQGIKDSDNPNDRERIVSLESPHNAMHLAIGGFYQRGVYNANDPAYQQANGDMGDNETASFDPIFFFHHCFIDYVLWCYQKKHRLTGQLDKGHKKLSVIYDYDGTVTDDQGSPVGLPPGSILDMNTPLIPFRHNTEDRYVTSHDVTDIEGELLNYTYGPGSLDPYVTQKITKHIAGQPSARLVDYRSVRGINRANIEGSFVIRTYALSADGKQAVEIGREAVLSRLNVRGCKNCQSHLEAQTFAPVYKGVLEFLGHDKARDVPYVVEVQTHSARTIYTHDGRVLHREGYGDAVDGNEDIGEPPTEHLERMSLSTAAVRGMDAVAKQVPMAVSMEVDEDDE